jgi:hypothetical protein
MVAFWVGLFGAILISIVAAILSVLLIPAVTEIDEMDATST